MVWRFIILVEVVVKELMNNLIYGEQLGSIIKSYGHGLHLENISNIKNYRITHINK